MEAHFFKICITEQDLNHLVGKYLPPDHPIEELQVHLIPSGVSVSGLFPMFGTVRFETHWEIGVAAGQITARLAQFKVLGIPADIFKSALVNLIEEFAKEEPWVQFEKDRLQINLDAFVGKFAFPACTNVTAISNYEGSLLIEGGRK